MKPLLKVNQLELVQNYQNIILLKSGSVPAKFTKDQLLPTIVRLLALTNHEISKESGAKLMANFQPDLFK
jgi:hypothetical protein